MPHIDDLIDRLELVRFELSVALAHESQLISQSEIAIDHALKATRAAAKAAQDVVNCKNANELAYLQLQSNEKAHYAQLFSAMSRDASELASQAKQENAKIFMEIKKVAELIALVLTEEQNVSSDSKSTG
ncbi:hypothetical protein [Paenibacillus sp. N3.4]|uniref:hypothetical protein n=1 Tax=Paenibacillus sp. N3.4 TaxID=2603222 RepID=UPI0011C7A498|nr:hypothetical protein [Paenibacillus sp. N3.4]TXK75159.1 hypothetical protein FU659_27715 [Paenibacillus sp. N3.4]